MVYDFASRLDLLGARFKALNFKLANISRGATIVTDVAVSPIHRSGEEYIPGVAITRIEFHTFVVDVADLGALFPPVVGDSLVLPDGAEYRVCSQDSQSPAYQYVTGSRTRILINTDMIKRPT